MDLVIGLIKLIEDHPKAVIEGKTYLQLNLNMNQKNKPTLLHFSKSRLSKNIIIYVKNSIIFY